MFCALAEVLMALPWCSAVRGWEDLVLREVARPHLPRPPLLPSFLPVLPSFHLIPPHPRPPGPRPSNGYMIHLSDPSFYQQPLGRVA
ncbi:hypothetical protein QBC32DRAFT_338809 [Pseudoneurospora amorphoporcata]|uniref:Secreted protein n=1 Tax=Pseudoneurospora amorphoporcata TaxID=241081 RepID=A0AAN6SHF3_9PEZI|nr:hypothetical protein QBC32DRAFT_338809 [Pseudoneurospora amorphoporcata]